MEMLFIILIIVHLLFLVLVTYKKRAIKDPSTNLSFCRLSDHILDFTGLNMLLYAVFIALWLFTTKRVRATCASVDDERADCEASFRYYNYTMRLSVLVDVLTKLITMT